MFCFDFCFFSYLRAWQLHMEKLDQGIFPQMILIRFSVMICIIIPCQISIQKSCHELTHLNQNSTLIYMKCVELQIKSISSGSFKLVTEKIDTLCFSDNSLSFLIIHWVSCMWAGNLGKIFILLVDMFCLFLDLLKFCLF